MKNNNKISIIDPVGGYGGMNYTTHGFCIGFILNNWEPYLFTSKGTPQKFPEIKTEFSFGDIWKKKYKFSKFLCLIKGYAQSFIFSNKNKIQYINLHFFRFGLINMFILFLARILFRGKIIVTVHDVESFHYPTNTYISRLGINLTHGLMFFNDFCKDEFKKIYGLTKPFCIIPHGNYLHYFKKLPTRNKTKNRNIKLLFFGQLKTVKGIDILLDAFKIVNSKSSDFELTIVGRPWKMSQKKLLEKFKSYSFGENFKYNLNYVSDFQVKEYYSESDLVILPYTRVYNSAVMLLSFSYGRAIISSDLPPFLETLENNVNGFYFKNGDSNKLAEVILSSIDYNLEKMGDNAYNTVLEKNDWKTHINKLINFMKSF